MSFGTNRWPDLQDTREWARETLRLLPELPAADTPAALLSRIATCEFDPAEDWNDSIDILWNLETTTSKVAPAGYYRDRETDLRNQVEHFATDFFRLERTVRRDQWHRLQQLCAPFPRLRLWLERLEPGLELDITVQTPGSSAVDALLGFLSQQFLACPGHRPEAIYDALATTFRDKSFWQPVAEELSRVHPDIGELFSPWLQEFWMPPKSSATRALASQNEFFLGDDPAIRRIVSTLRFFARGAQMIWAVIIWEPPPVSPKPYGLDFIQKLGLALVWLVLKMVMCVIACLTFSAIMYATL